MKEIQLTRGYVALVDDDDFEELSKYKWCVAVYKYGNAYAVAKAPLSNSGQKMIYMHRLIISANKGQCVDHIDCNSLNNTKSNLRICTQSQNSKNRGKCKRNTTGFCGVTKSPKGFVARIMSDRNMIYIGTHKTAYEAALAYDKAAIEYHGEFANLNFPIKLSDQ